MDLKIHISNSILFCFLSFDLDMHLSLQGESPSFFSDKYTNNYHCLISKIVKIH